MLCIYDSLCWVKNFKRYWPWNSAHFAINICICLRCLFFFYSSVFINISTFYQIAIWSLRPLNWEGIEGVQNRSLQHVPLFGVVDYFAEGSQDPADSRKTFTSLLTAWKNLDRGVGPGRELSAEITTKNMSEVW